MIFEVVRQRRGKQKRPNLLPCVKLMVAALIRLPNSGEFVFAKRNGKPYHAIRGFRGNSKKFYYVIHYTGDTTNPQPGLNV